MNNTTGQPKQIESRINSSMNGLSNSIVDLDKSVRELHERLRPILSVEPASEMAGQTPCPKLNLLADSIGEKSDHVVSIKRIIDEMIRLIEL